MQLVAAEFHVLIVDDHPIVREGVAQVLQRVRPGCRVSQAGSAADARALLSLHPDMALVVLDLHLDLQLHLQPHLQPHQNQPGQPLLQPLLDLRAAYPLLAVLMMSADEDPDIAQRALRAGAAGFVPKSANPTLLANALQLVLDGGCYVPPFLLASKPAEPSPAGSLTERQRDVLKLLVDGRPNKDIARGLGLAEPTVKAHLVNIFRILGVKNLAQAAMAGGRWLR